MSTQPNKPDLAAERRAIEVQTAETLKVITPRGFVLDTADWLTIANYAVKYDVTTHVVTNWIRRGIIPTNCVYTFPELNDLRMIKDQVYKSQSRKD